MAGPLERFRLLLKKYIRDPLGRFCLVSKLLSLMILRVLGRKLLLRP